MSWRLFERVARFSPRASRPEWQFPLARRAFQSTAIDPTIDLVRYTSGYNTVAELELQDLEEMAQAKAEVVQLQQLLGLVPPAKNKPVKDVIFVSIDCEAFEHDQNKITEIGVSILDSRSIKDVDPGDNGEPWFKLMKHLHLRPNEYKKLVNKRFIKGCPDNFEFGTSTAMKLRDAGKILDRIFLDPNRLHEACDFGTQIPETDIEIMLVGHDLRNDTEYMKRLKFTPKRVVGSLDTQKLARISKRQSPGLQKLLTALSIDAKYLHNAGNDAAYTLQALVGLAVQEHRRPGDLERALIAENARRDAERFGLRAEQAAAAGPAVAGPTTAVTVQQGVDAPSGKAVNEAGALKVRRHVFNDRPETTQQVVVGKSKGETTADATAAPKIRKFVTYDNRLTRHRIANNTSGETTADALGGGPPKVRRIAPNGLNEERHRHKELRGKQHLKKKQGPSEGD
ncbi:hypothetical protein Q7P37_000427 [Cladosporium fusiforme]